MLRNDPNTRFGEKSNRKRIGRRQLMVEFLQQRQLFAVDSAELILPNLAVPRDSSIAANTPVKQSLSYSSNQAEEMSLSEDPDDIYFDYGPLSVKLPSELNVANLSPMISGDGIFTALPQIQGNSLTFRLSGKPGVHGAALIWLQHDNATSPALSYEVALSNESKFNSLSAERSEPSESDWDMIAEGEYPSGSGGVSILNLVAGDATAAEPHRIYCQEADNTASFKIERINWGGGQVNLALSGAAKFGIDYGFGSGLTSFTYDSGNNQVSFDLPSGTTPFEILVYALQDSAEPGQKDSQGQVDGSSETVQVNWVPDTSLQLSGNANLAITDELESVSISGNPSTTSELSEPTDPAAAVHLTASKALCTSIYWHVKNPSPNGSEDENLATLGADYGLSDERSESPFFEPLEFPTPSWDAQYPNLVQSNPRNVNNDSDFTLFVRANPDLVLEGDEKADFRVYLPGLDAAFNDSAKYAMSLTNFATVTVTEDYGNAKTEKDEKSGCSCTCTTCPDGNQVDVDPATGSATIAIADGMAIVSTGNQTGPNPVVYVGFKLPAGKAIPTSISASAQVVEKRTGSTGQLVGLGRKLAPTATASPTVTFAIPPTAIAGTTLWFAMQADLSAQVASWNRSSGTTPGNNGVTEKIVPLELLVNATFPAGVSPSQKYSGFVGRTNHAMRDQTASSLAPGVGQNISVTGVDRMIRNQEIILPDENGTGGKIKLETGSLLFRANGGNSWFAENSQPAPDSQDVLAGDYLTDRYNNKKRFNALGDMIERRDAAGNTTFYGYAVDGSISTITDPRGQSTSFTQYTNAQGYKSVKITTTNTGIASNNRTYDLVWRPFTPLVNGQLTVTSDDPDGTGPRSARQDVFNYSTTGYLTSIGTGAVGTPTHLTNFSHRDSAQGDRRLSTVAYADGSSLSIELTRQGNSLITTGYTGGTVPFTDPRALFVDPVGTASTLPNYAVMTYKRSPSSDPQRTIVQLDHRGRVLRSWDPVQVAALGLATPGIAWNSTTFQLLQANKDLSTEYGIQPTQRDSYGRITGKDYGEVLTVTSPDPDRVGTSNGPRARQITTLTYLNNNPDTRKQPLQAQETIQWNDTFDIATQFKDATGNTTHQEVNPTNGLVTQLRTVQQGVAFPNWQNPLNPLDVNGDGLVSPTDAQLVINYLGNPGGGPVPNSPPAPFFLDTSGDNYISPTDANLVITYLGASVKVVPDPVGSLPKTLSQVDFIYEANPTLPKGLVGQSTVKTGRAEGDNVIVYKYNNTPTDKARHGKLWTVTESSSSGTAVTAYLYDDRGNLSQVTDPVGRVTKMWYDNRDRLIAQMTPDPDGPPPVGSTVSLLPVLMRYDYDVFDNVISTELINSRIEAGNVYVTALTTSYTYDNGNRLTASITQNPNLSWYLTASGSNISRSTSKPPATSTITQALLESYAVANSQIPNTPITNVSYQGLKTTYDYFSTANVVTVTESNAGGDPRVSTFTYDQLNRLVKVTNPNPQSGIAQIANKSAITRYAYDNLGSTTSVTDAFYNVTSFTYDDLNRVVQQSSPSASALIGATGTTATLSSVANDQYGNPTLVTMSGLSGLANVKVGDSITISNALNAVNNGTFPITAVNSGNGTITYWGQNFLAGQVNGQPIVSDARNGSINWRTSPAFSTLVAYAATVKGWKISTTNPAGELISTQTDMLGRVVDVAGATPKKSISYWTDGLLKSVKDEKAQTTDYGYDQRGRLLTVTAPPNVPSGSRAVTTYQYTLDNLVNKVIDPMLRETSTSYDSGGRPFRVTQPDPDGAGSLAAAYSEVRRDAIGNIMSTTDGILNPQGKSTNYTYDSWFRPLSTTDANGAITSTAYDVFGNISSVTDPLSNVTSYTYNKLNQLTSETKGISQSYLYDLMGNLRSTTDRANGRNRLSALLALVSFVVLEN